jgi:hypothetical protein
MFRTVLDSDTGLHELVANSYCTYSHKMSVPLENFLHQICASISGLDCGEHYYRFLQECCPSGELLLRIHASINRLICDGHYTFL